MFYSYNEHKIKNAREEEVVLSKKRQKKEYCKKCRKETIHTLTEDALEINCYCHECHSQQDIIKTFF
jgi:ribosomal protein L33